MEKKKYQSDDKNRNNEEFMKWKDRDGKKLTKRNI